MPGKSTIGQKARAFIRANRLPIAAGPDIVDRLTAYIRERYGGVHPLRLSWQARLRVAKVAFVTPRKKLTIEQRASRFIERHQLPVDPADPAVIRRLTEYVRRTYPLGHRTRNAWDRQRSYHLPTSSKQANRTGDRPSPRKGVGGRPAHTNFVDALCEFVVRRGLPIAPVEEHLEARVAEYCSTYPRQHTIRRSYEQLRARWVRLDPTLRESGMVRRARRFIRRHQLPVRMDVATVVAELSAYMVTLEPYDVLKRHWASILSDAASKGDLPYTGRRRRPSSADVMLAQHGLASGQTVGSARANALRSSLDQYWSRTYSALLTGDDARGWFWRSGTGAEWAVRILMADDGQTAEVAAVRMSRPYKRQVQGKEQICDHDESMTKFMTSTHIMPHKAAKKSNERGVHLSPDLQHVTLETPRG